MASEKAGEPWIGVEIIGKTGDCIQAFKTALNRTRSSSALNTISKEEITEEFSRLRIWEQQLGLSQYEPPAAYSCLRRPQGLAVDVKGLILAFLQELKAEVDAINPDPTAASTPDAEDEDEDEELVGDEDSMLSLTFSSESDVSSDIEDIRTTSHNEGPPTLLPRIKDTIGELFELLATAAMFGFKSAQCVQHDAPMADEDFLKLKSSATEIVTKHFPALPELPGLLGRIADSVVRRRRRFEALQDQGRLFKTHESHKNWGVGWIPPLNTELRCGPCGSHLSGPLALKSHWNCHVSAKLEPYVCLFENCADSFNCYEDQAEWILHMKRVHAPSWTCHTHRDTWFTTKKDFLEHIHGKHPHATEESMQIMMRVCISFVTNPFKKLLSPVEGRTPVCLFCRDPISEEQATEHFAGHLEIIALLSLPPEEDLKAHMPTHQMERREICPMATCEHHTKGFARKYDKNRHTLTHFEDNMVCGFCPGSVSATEKTFNRAEVFKRHLTSAHGVERTPSSARRRSPPDAATVVGTQKRIPHGTSVQGTCSTCAVIFVNAQEFYDHLDDCLLRVAQQTDPGEATNQRLLSFSRQMAERHVLFPHPADRGPTSVDMTSGSGDDDADTDDGDGSSTHSTLDARSSRKSTMPSRVAPPTATSSLTGSPDWIEDPGFSRATTEMIGYNEAVWKYLFADTWPSTPLRQSLSLEALKTSSKELAVLAAQRRAQSSYYLRWLEDLFLCARQPWISPMIHQQREALLREAVNTPHFLHRMHIRSSRTSDDGVTVLASSPSGPLVASGLRSGEVGFHNFWTGQETPTVRDPRDRISPLGSRTISSLAWSPDGRLLASGAGDGSIRVWDPSTGEALRTLDGHQFGVNGMCFSGDGSVLASGSDDATVRIWNVRMGTETHMLRGHHSPLTAVALSHDGAALASACTGGTLSLWDVKSGTQTGELAKSPLSHGHSLPALGRHCPFYTALAFSRDGKDLAAGSSNGNLYAGNLGNARFLGRLRFEGRGVVTAVAFSADLRTVAAVSRNVPWLWDLGTGEAMKQDRADDDLSEQAALTRGDGSKRHWFMDTVEEMEQTRADDGFDSQSALTRDARLERPRQCPKEEMERHRADDGFDKQSALTRGGGSKRDHMRDRERVCDDCSRHRATGTETAVPRYRRDKRCHAEYSGT